MGWAKFRAGLDVKDSLTTGRGDGLIVIVAHLLRLYPLFASLPLPSQARKVSTRSGLTTRSCSMLARCFRTRPMMSSRSSERGIWVGCIQWVVLRTSLRFKKRLNISIDPWKLSIIYRSRPKWSPNCTACYVWNYRVMSTRIGKSGLLDFTAWKKRTAPPPPVVWTLFYTGIRCCRSDWPGLCLFCCY